MDRNHIYVHYLPARRDPSDHIGYGTNALLGRFLRATNWEQEMETFNLLSDKISQTLAQNDVIGSISTNLGKIWQAIHKGEYFKDPTISFGTDGIDTILKNITLSFTPSHSDSSLDYTRLSDGQKSILYLSLVLATLHAERSITQSIDITKLRPPFFTIIAIEEPENSLSPHYLGRIVTALCKETSASDCQSIVATHSASMLKRIAPKDIRYLRLDPERQSTITEIILPSKTESDTYKYVRGAVQAYPELYFARFVLLVEGDSEEIVLPRLLRVKGVPVDEYGISIVPLGGRHVNHFWRLLEALHIPYMTLLDLDLARYEGGWGRIKYIISQVKKHRNEDDIVADLSDETIPQWNDDKNLLRENENDKNTPNYIQKLESRGIYYSSPLDFDFEMLKAYPDAYQVNDQGRGITDDKLLNSVLGSSHGADFQYTDNEKDFFYSYHKLFKLGSKPATHFAALAFLDDHTLMKNIPETYKRMIENIRSIVEAISE